MSTARDLFLLSAIAFQEGKFEQAGLLITASLSADDAGEFLEQVDKLQDNVGEDQESTSSESNSSMSDIARQIALAMQDQDQDHEVLSAEDLDIEEGSDADFKDDLEDPVSDVVDPATPGETLIPSSLSGVASAVRVKTS